MPDIDTPDGEASPELAALARELRHDLRNLRESFRRLILVQWLGFRTRAVSSFFSAILLLCLVGFCVSAAVLSAVFIANGARQAFGDMGAGFALLVVITAMILALRAWFRGQGVRSAKRAMEHKDPEDP